MAKEKEAAVAAEGVVDLSGAVAMEQSHDRGIEAPIYLNGDQIMVITIAGPYSDRFKRADEELAKTVLSARKPRAQRIAEAGSSHIDLLAKCTLAWSSPVMVDGERLEFSEANSLKLYRRHKFIMDQVQEAFTAARDF